MSNNTILKALERIGYKGRMTGHGFRGLASTLLHEQGYQHDHIELQLANAARNAVSAAYNHALHLKAHTRLMHDADFSFTPPQRQRPWTMLSCFCRSWRTASHVARKWTTHEPSSREEEAAADRKTPHGCRLTLRDSTHGT